ncbi:hypothetical protein ACFLX5_00715 [Chloroflexota bacterium]
MGRVKTKRKLFGKDIERRIISIMSRSSLPIEYMDFLDTEKRLHSMGIRFGNTGPALYEAFRNLTKKGLLIAYFQNGGKNIHDIAFLYWKDWQKAIEEYPSLRNQLVELSQIGLQPHEEASPGPLSASESAIYDGWQSHI